MDSKETDEKEQADGPIADQVSKEDNKREASEKHEESPELGPDPNIPTTSGSRRSPSPLRTAKSASFLDTGKSFAKAAFSAGSKLWQRKQSDVPASTQSTSPTGEASGQLDRGQA
ncbi:hypothetical protein AAVH_19838, partial [Aphelenchoides avenae]